MWTVSRAPEPWRVCAAGACPSLCHVTSHRASSPSVLCHVVTLCPCRPHGWPVTVRLHLWAVLCPPHHHMAPLSLQGLCLSLLRGHPHSPVPLPAGSCLPHPPFHRPQQSRGLFPATETVVAALAGPCHRYHPNLAAMTTPSGHCVPGILPVSQLLSTFREDGTCPVLTSSLCMSHPLSLCFL